MTTHVIITRGRKIRRTTEFTTTKGVRHAHVQEWDNGWTVERAISVASLRRIHREALQIYRNER